jgi:hypothetical protein
MSTNRIMIIGHGRSINEISTEGYRRGCQIDVLLKCSLAWPILSQMRSAYRQVFIVNAVDDAALLALCLKRAQPPTDKLITLIAANYEEGDIGRFRDNPVIHSVLQEPVHINEVAAIYDSLGISAPEISL